MEGHSKAKVTITFRKEGETKDYLICINLDELETKYVSTLEPLHYPANNEEVFGSFKGKVYYLGYARKPRLDSKLNNWI